MSLAKKRHAGQKILSHTYLPFPFGPSSRNPEKQRLALMACMPACRNVERNRNPGNEKTSVDAAYLGDSWAPSQNIRFTKKNLKTLLSQCWKYVSVIDREYTKCVLWE